MTRGKSLIVLLSVYALVLSNAGFGAESPAELIKQAEQLCVKKQFREAEEIYLNIIRQATDAEQRFSAQRKLAAVYVAEDKQPLATALVRNILADYAQHERLPHAIHEIAESCQKFGKAAKAKEIYQAILTDQPGHPQKIWLDMGLAISNVLAGEPDAGWSATQRLLNDYRTDNRAAEAVGQVAWCYRKQKDFQNARTLYQYVVDTWSENERAIYSQRGIVLASIELKDSSAAQSAIDRLLRDYSQHEDFLSLVWGIAETYQGKSDFRNARELHQYIVDNHPNSERAIYSQQQIALANIELKDEPNAAAATEKLLLDFSKNKDFVGVVAGLAKEYKDRWKFKESRRLHQFIVDNFPKSEQALPSQRDVILASIGLADDPNAEAAIDKLLKDFAGDPRIGDVTYQVARTIHWKDGDKAKQLYEYIVERQPASEAAVSARVCLGGLMLAAGDEQGARAVFDKVLEDYRGQVVLPHAVGLMAEAYWNEAARKRPKDEGPPLPPLPGQARVLDKTYAEYLGKAAAEWEKIINDLPEDTSHTAEAYFMSGECSRALGDLAKAVERYEVLVRRWPDYKHSVYAQLLIADCIESLMKAGKIPKAEAVVALRDACQKILTEYPDSPAAGPAKGILRRWERFNAEGRMQ